MRVLRLHGTGDLRLHDEAEPRPERGEELVRVTSVGICGSDLHWFEEGGIGDAQLDRPLVLGHEFGGIIEEGPRRGMRVAVDPAIVCNTCEHCLQGNPNFCADTRFSGHGTQDGAFRELMAWPSELLFPIPDGFSDDDAAMLEPLGVAIHAVDLARIRPGMHVGVFGAGPIGLLVLQVARMAGATKTYATDIRAHRLDAARALGADSTFQARSDAGEGDEIWQASASRGLDVIFEAAGDNAAVEAALAAVRPGGALVLLGVPSDDRTQFTASVARRKGVTIRLVRRMKHVYPRAIELVRSGRIDVRSIVSHRFGLRDHRHAFDVARRREGLKVVIDPTIA